MCSRCKTAAHVCQRIEGATEKGGIMIVLDIAESAECMTTIEDVFNHYTYGHQLRMLLTKALQVNLDNVTITFAVKCHTPHKAKPVDMVACSAYLKEELRYYEPSVVVAVGKIPTDLFGITGSIKSHNQMVYDFPYKSAKGTKAITKLLIAQHLGFVLNAGNAEVVTFAKVFETANRIATTGVVKKSPTVWKQLSTIGEVKSLIKDILTTGVCCFDFETVKLTDRGTFDPNFKATLLSISYQPGASFVIPLEHFESKFSREDVYKIFALFGKHVFSNPAVQKIGQNVKFDMHVASRYGCTEWFGRVDDTMVMHALYRDCDRHGLDKWVPEFFPQFRGWKMETKGKDWAKIPMNILAPYAATDTDATLRGFIQLEKILLEDARVYSIYRHLIVTATKAIYRMEEVGNLLDSAKIVDNKQVAYGYVLDIEAVLRGYPEVKRFIASESAAAKKRALITLTEKRDKAKTERLRLKYSETILAIESGNTAVAHKMNFGSPAQLAKLLYSSEGFNFKNIEVKGKVDRTGKDILKGIKDNSGFINNLMILRALNTNANLYFTGLYELLDSNNRVHSTYSLAGTATGRLSSNKPNLQNISTHVKVKHAYVEDVVKRVKRQFIAEEGCRIMQIDYSQFELRLVAEFAGETNMINAYLSGKDLHILTACRVTGITEEKYFTLPEKEQKELRSKAKAANFGLIYGQSAKGFMEYAKNNYGVTMNLTEATDLRDKFFEAYPKLLDYHAEYIAKGKKFGYVRTLFGRRRLLEDIQGFDEFKRGEDERVAVNSPIQGSGGEMCIFSLSRSSLCLPKHPKLYIMNTVHDSIILHVPDELVPYTAKLLKRKCESTDTEQFFGKKMQHLIPKVDIEISELAGNWGQLTKYEI